MEGTDLREMSHAGRLALSDAGSRAENQRDFTVQTGLQVALNLEINQRHLL